MIDFQQGVFGRHDYGRFCFDASYQQIHET